jgi:hypothetical protein
MIPPPITATPRSATGGCYPLAVRGAGVR